MDDWLDDWLDDLLNDLLNDSKLATREEVVDTWREAALGRMNGHGCKRRVEVGSLEATKREDIDAWRMRWRSGEEDGWREQSSWCVAAAADSLDAALDAGN